MGPKKGNRFRVRATGYEQHAVALRNLRSDIKEAEIGALWAALGASDKAEHKQRAESGFVAGQSCGRDVNKTDVHTSLHWCLLPPN